MIVTTDRRTSQNHRLQTSQSDQRAHLCVLCCFKTNTQIPFELSRKKLHENRDHRFPTNPKGEQIIKKHHPLWKAKKGILDTICQKELFL